ncbi:monovalent cation/H(+) antiporter subunit G [Thioalkalivibrio sulfidiphilus]|uniref:monovalent cation/H(+) antiporter subunit G n=1 Tax=Thioalkalivibrio sulfidiphilus TaxID=1033854 RepID=UPI00036AA853|nr:monovalent cation/H(+) antiporter subunit G [Thioalkalivibrio sulfidiphilus]
MTLIEGLGLVLVLCGIPFFFLGTLGLLRFPDVYTRLHALAKGDNVGLGLVCLGLGLQSGSLTLALKMLAIWLLMLIASAAGAGLIARTALARGVKPWGL